MRASTHSSQMPTSTHTLAVVGAWLGKNCHWNQSGLLQADASALVCGGCQVAPGLKLKSGTMTPQILFANTAWLCLHKGCLLYQSRRCHEESGTQLERPHRPTVPWDSQSCMYPIPSMATHFLSEAPNVKEKKRVCRHNPTHPKVVHLQRPGRVRCAVHEGRRCLPNELPRPVLE